MKRKIRPPNPREESDDCDSCDGEGTVRFVNADGDQEEATCGECFGTGKRSAV